MEIKDTREIKDFPVSTGNLRFPLDFQDTKNLRFLRESRAVNCERTRFARRGRWRGLKFGGIITGQIKY